MTSMQVVVNYLILNISMKASLHERVPFHRIFQFAYICGSYKVFIRSLLAVDSCHGSTLFENQEEFCCEAVLTAKQNGRHHSCYSLKGQRSQTCHCGLRERQVQFSFNCSDFLKNQQGCVLSRCYTWKLICKWDLALSGTSITCFNCRFWWIPLLICVYLCFLLLLIMKIRPCSLFRLIWKTLFLDTQMLCKPCRKHSHSNLALMVFIFICHLLS